MGCGVTRRFRSRGNCISRCLSREYGVYRPADGVCERALFVLDAEGVVRWSYVSPIGVNPGADGVLTALESLGAADRPAAHSARPART